MSTVSAKAANTNTPTVGVAKQAPAAWHDEAQAATARALESFGAAVTGLENLGREVWGAASALTSADASVLINRAKASIIEIDAASKKTAGEAALPAFATKAIADIYSSLTRVMPQAATSRKAGWVSSLPSQDRKNLASYQALGALVSKLTKP